MFPYRNLALRADYDAGQLNVSALTLNAYGGSIESKAAATLNQSRPFRASVNLTNIDLEQALGAQGAKAADTVRGSLTGQVNAAGNGTDFDDIEPTLQGQRQDSNRFRQVDWESTWLAPHSRR